MGLWFLGKNSLRRNQNLGDLPWRMIPLLKLHEGVSEVNDVLMAVDVGHDSKSESGRRGISGRVSVEDDRDNQGQTTKPYISIASFQLSPLSSLDLPRPLSVHQTLNPDGSL